MTTRVPPGELRAWIDDALDRHDRDVRERGETPDPPTVTEIIDAVWGRLPLEIRRRISRSDVQASLTMLAARRGIVAAREHPGPAPRGELGGSRHRAPE